MEAKICCLKLGGGGPNLVMKISPKVLQQRAKHRARSKELLEEVATVKCSV